LEAELHGPVPTEFVALTLNVYDVEPLKQLTVIGLEAPVPVLPPGHDVAVYPVILVPPLHDGAVNATVALVAVTAVAVPIVGAAGAENVLMPELLALALPLPAEFVALTENV
jgi:hypothetical protein